MKTWLKIVIIIVAIMVIIASLFCFAWFALVGSYEREQDELNIEKKNIEKLCTEYVQQHMKDKYPELEYTIDSVSIDDETDGLAHIGWRDDVYVHIEIDNKEYTIYTSLNEDNKGRCADDIQKDEINQAIHTKFSNVFNLPAECKIKTSFDHSMTRKYFYGKYEGDITQFLANEKQYDDNGSCLYFAHNKINENTILTNEQILFLNAFDRVVFVCFEDEFETAMDGVMNAIYYDNEELIMDKLNDRKIAFHSIWSYNFEKEVFENVTK